MGIEFYIIVFLTKEEAMETKKPSNPRYKSICLPCESEAEYLSCVTDPLKFRRFVEEMSEFYPELFPSAMSGGFNLHDKYNSLKQGYYLRRIKLKATQEVYLIRPSSLLPYLSGKTDEIEKALYLRQWGVPFEALAYCFGRDAMYYYRAWTSLGRNQIVGTTVKKEENLPEHLIADEKHTWHCGEKNYLATTVGGGCFLGASLCEEAGTESLEPGYRIFLTEAQEIKEDYKPKTVCTDGWKATREVWKKLFPTIVLIRCFLHSVLKIKSFARKTEEPEICQQAWRVYQASKKVEFSQRMRRFKEWAEKKTNGKVQEMILKLCQLKKEFWVFYDHPQAARTSNGLDRLMDYQDRVLYSMRYFHGKRETAELAVRAMALQWNFHPYSLRAQHNGAKSSPFATLNGFQYQANWLQNLLCAASMGGRRL